MVVFELEAFVSDPSVKQLDKCKKRDLHLIAEHYSIVVSSSLRKDQLKAAVLEGLVSQKVLVAPGPDTSSVSSSDTEGAGEGEEGQAVNPAQQHEGTVGKPVTLPPFVPSSSESSPGSKLDVRMKVRLQRLEMEREGQEREFQLRRELELKKLDAETAVRMRQLELQAREHSHGRTITSGFDVSKNISLVPVFRESEVEVYFGVFERIAAALQWPKDVWAILLQCRLTGKAQEACSALSVEDGLSYEKAKGAILRAYELVPEAYRQRFRNLRKTTDQTYVDLAREKITLFDRWCAASKADDFTSLTELVLLEEFKNCLPERTAVYMNEQKVTNLQQAAILADEFTLTHKTWFSRHVSFPPSFSQKPASATPTGRVRDSGKATPNSKIEKLCFFCRKPDHLVADCDAWKRNQGPERKYPKGVGLIRTSLMPSQVSLARGEPDVCFRPFVSDGFVSLTGEPGDGRPVRVLRDTACSQSLLLAEVLPVGDRSDVQAIVRGIGMGFVPAPLHRIYINTELVTGFFTVGVRPSFPIEGIDLYFGERYCGWESVSGSKSGGCSHSHVRARCGGY